MHASCLRAAGRAVCHPPARGLLCYIVVKLAQMTRTGAPVHRIIVSTPRGWNDSNTTHMQVLFHWEMDEARPSATRLYRAFSAPPMGDGPRIALGYGPRQAELQTTPCD